ncbi:hypothetical protein V9T40_001077 [Parthenolecanium corni]|uniref:AH domain-containing protein n=1 Tax=Parthenolecanium corni TaxID=536013 RepID=A0AAN9TAI9_9HEMI
MSTVTPTVERNLHEMLRDAPMMNDSNTAVHSGFTNQQLPKPIKTFTNPEQESLTSPTKGNDSLKLPLAKIETIKCWGVSTYKCTRQLMYEKLGKTSRTVDKDLETQIDFLRDTQKKYSNLAKLSRILSSHFYHVVQTQQALGEAFSELSQKSPELQEEFKSNAETQRSLSKNGEMLLNALNSFLSSINTLCSKTIEDTLMTIRQYETARIEYDAYRMDLETLAQTPRTDANTVRIDEAQLSYQKYKEDFEKLRNDVEVKLKFLEDNRIKVMRSQLTLLNGAVAAYFSGNHQLLESTLKSYCIKNVKVSPIAAPWLER